MFQHYNVIISNTSCREAQVFLRVVASEMVDEPGKQWFQLLSLGYKQFTITV